MLIASCANPPNTADLLEKLQKKLEPSAGVTSAPIETTTPAQKPPVVPTPAPVPVPVPAPTSRPSSLPAPTLTTSKPYPTITHSQFVSRMGKQKLSSLVGTGLELNLRPGGNYGWEGFVHDERTLTFFSCPAGSRFNGGPLIAKVAKIRSNDNGVFVQLDRCDP